MYQDHNVIRRVNRAGGLIGLFRTQHHNVSDQVRGLNSQGYRVSFIVSDSWTFVQWIGALLLLGCTLGVYTKAPGLLVVGERIMATPAHVGTPAPSIPQLAVGSS